MTDEQILATLPWTLEPNRGVCAPMADGPRRETARIGVFHAPECSLSGTPAT